MSVSRHQLLFSVRYPIRQGRIYTTYILYNKQLKCLAKFSKNIKPHNNSAFVDILRIYRLNAQLRK